MWIYLIPLSLAGVLFLATLIQSRRNRDQWMRRLQKQERARAAMDRINPSARR